MLKIDFALAKQRSAKGGSAMEGERISYDESVRRVYDRIKKDGMSNIWDTYEAQGI